MSSNFASRSDARLAEFSKLIRGLQEGPCSMRREAAHEVWKTLFYRSDTNPAAQLDSPKELIPIDDLAMALAAALRAGRGTSDDDCAVRYWVCRAIMCLGPIEETLTEVATGQEELACALGEIGGAALPVLIRALGNPEDSVRKAAAGKSNRAADTNTTETTDPGEPVATAT